MTENKDVVAERDTLKTTIETQVQSFESERTVLKDQVDALTQERTVLEKSLTDEKARSEKVVSGEIALVCSLPSI